MLRLGIVQGQEAQGLLGVPIYAPSRPYFGAPVPAFNVATARCPVTQKLWEPYSGRPNHTFEVAATACHSNGAAVY